MFKLPIPNILYSEVLDACIAGITGNPILKGKLTSDKNDLLNKAIDYDTFTPLAQLHRIHPVTASNTKITTNLTKEDLKKLYTQYFTPADKPAGVVYDRLRMICKDECPFCAGIGTPENLDHFLAKSKFPQFSVFPNNLVPSCRDCNMGEKGQTHPSNPNEQYLHPFLDDDIFYNEQWVFATYHPPYQASAAIEFFTNPPLKWQNFQRARACKHFIDFNIKARYAKLAANELVSTLDQMRKLLKLGFSAKVVTETICEPIYNHSKGPNHWRTVMYMALEDHLIVNGSLD
ncbi:hypothetical protein KFE96_04935 [Kordiimonas sp. SCSIO 12603]|uniref:HNH endonuclease n=1 Tax=Kordiimonas sp. SCSIO 12603 TaxID=2829596 RepID=UPI002103E67B|nr:hypothetical protein [Kordiimonas sp. SCSIO 12603]UTW59651.1 hypothetical protein KFE96_04935 [Kordiimonas sp. SCSIO 12603]